MRGTTVSARAPGGFVVYVLGQKKLFKEPVGIVHFIIFWGFIVIAFGTLQIIGEGLWEAFSLPVVGAWTGFYLVLDVLMVLVLAAIVVAVVYRYVVRPPRLEASLEAAVILALIFGLIAAALVYSGFAYALDCERQVRARAGHRRARGAVRPAGRRRHRRPAWQVFWWVHLVLLLAFLVYIPLSKHLHLIMCPVNEFFRNLKPRGGQIRPLDLEDEDLEEYGVSRIDGFTRWQLLDLYACAECGRCQDHCPAWLTGKPLSPKLLMTKLKDHLNEAGPGLRRAAAGNGGARPAGAARPPPRARPPTPQHDRRRHRRGRALGLHHLLVLPGAVPGAERARQQDHRHAPQPGARPRRVPAGGAAGLPQHREERQPVGHRRAHARRLGQGPGRPRRSTPTRPSSTSTGSAAPAPSTTAP